MSTDSGSAGLAVRTIGEILHVPEEDNFPVSTMFLTVSHEVMIVPVGKSHFRKAGIELIEGTQFSAEVTAGSVSPSRLDPHQLTRIEQLSEFHESQVA